MKSKEHSGKKLTSLKISEPFARRLVAYSATAGAALLAAPVADAAIQNINSLSLSLDLPQNGGYQSLSFDVGPFHGAFNGHRGTYKQMSYVPGSFNPGTPPYTAPGGTSFPGSPSFSNPGYSRTVGTNRYGRANLSGNIAGGLASRLDRGIPFAGLAFSNNSHLLASRSSYGGGTGNFRGQSGYIAFQTGSYYGWLKVKVGLDADGVPNQISLVDDGNGIVGAFDKTSEALADGFNVGIVAAPEPSIAAIAGLGLLAFGAVGVREMRRRKAAAQK
jgi:hypothetical protein